MRYTFKLAGSPSPRPPNAGHRIAAFLGALGLAQPPHDTRQDDLYARCDPTPTPGPQATPCQQTYPCYFAFPPSWSEYTVGDCIRFDIGDVPGLVRPLEMRLRGVETFEGDGLIGGAFSPYFSTSNSFIYVLTDLSGVYDVIGSEALAGAFCPCGPAIVVRPRSGIVATPTPTPVANEGDPAPQIRVSSEFSDTDQFVFTRGKLSLDGKESWIYPITIENVGTAPLVVYRVYPRNYPLPYKINEVEFPEGRVICPGDAYCVPLTLDADMKGLARDINGFSTGTGLTQSLQIGIESNDPRTPIPTGSFGWLANVRVELFTTLSADDTVGVPAVAPPECFSNFCSFSSCNGLLDINCDAILDVSDVLDFGPNLDALLGRTR